MSGRRLLFLWFIIAASATAYRLVVHSDLLGLFDEIYFSGATLLIVWINRSYLEPSVEHKDREGA